jgi:hypothetical protein
MTKIATTINGKIISSVIVLGKSLTYVEFVTTTVRLENTDGIRAAKITTDIIIKIAYEIISLKSIFFYTSLLIYRYFVQVYIVLGNIIMV